MLFLITIGSCLRWPQPTAIVLLMLLLLLLLLVTATVVAVVVVVAAVAVVIVVFTIAPSAIENQQLPTKIT